MHTDDVKNNKMNEQLTTPNSTYIYMNLQKRIGVALDPLMPKLESL